jgi:hypothetical protein
MTRVGFRRLSKVGACILGLVFLALSFGGYKVVRYNSAVAMLEELGWRFLSEASSSRTEDGGVVIMQPAKRLDNLFGAIGIAGASLPLTAAQQTRSSDLRSLEALSGVISPCHVSIVGDGLRIDATQMAVLVSNPYLQSIALGGIDVSDEAISFLAKSTTLERVSLMGCDVPSDSIRVLFTCRTMSAITVDSFTMDYSEVLGQVRNGRSHSAVVYYVRRGKGVSGIERVDP